MKVVGYVRVSTEEQGRSGLGLAAQREAITASVAARGWELLRIEEDVASGASTNGRPGLDRTLASIRGREADGLVVAKLDRLGRSVIDAATLIGEAQQKGWNLVALDMGLDLSTPAGELVAHVLAAVAQWERRVISERIKDALAAKRAAGWDPTAGPERKVAVLRLHRRGMSQRAIASELGLHKESVRRVLSRSA